MSRCQRLTLDIVEIFQQRVGKGSVGVSRGRQSSFPRKKSATSRLNRRSNFKRSLQLRITRVIKTLSDVSGGRVVVRGLAIAQAARVDAYRLSGDRLRPLFRSTFSRLVDLVRRESSNLRCVPANFFSFKLSCCYYERIGDVPSTRERERISVGNDENSVARGVQQVLD